MTVKTTWAMRVALVGCGSQTVNGSRGGVGGSDAASDGARVDGRRGARCPGTDRGRLLARVTAPVTPNGRSAERPRRFARPRPARVVVVVGRARTVPSARGAVVRPAPRVRAGRCGVGRRARAVSSPCRPVVQAARAVSPVRGAVARPARGAPSDRRTLPAATPAKKADAAPRREEPSPRDATHPRAAMSEDDQLLTLPDSIVRGLAEEFVATLPANVQRILRARRVG